MCPVQGLPLYSKKKKKKKKKTFRTSKGMVIRSSANLKFLLFTISLSGCPFRFKSTESAKKKKKIVFKVFEIFGKSKR